MHVSHPEQLWLTAVLSGGLIAALQKRVLPAARGLGGDASVAFPQLPCAEVTARKEQARWALRPSVIANTPQHNLPMGVWLLQCLILLGGHRES